MTGTPCSTPFEETTGLEKEEVKFTGVVVTYNEDRRLQECLHSLSFCDQLLVIDLGSEDKCIEIAREYDAEVVHHRWVPVVEQVWPNIISKAHNDWIIRADPDEVFSASLVNDVAETIMESDSIGVIALPHQYYFRGEPLNTTSWGGNQYARKVFHKARVRLQPHVHRGIQPLEGYEVVQIERVSDNHIQHYWVDSYRELFEKHWRYIRREGKSRYNNGQRFSWWDCTRATWKTLQVNLIDHRGLCGGRTGVFLSFFRALYMCLSFLSLRQYQKHLSQAHTSE